MLQIPWFRSVNLAMDGPTARRWQSLCGGWQKLGSSSVSVAQGIRNECALQSEKAQQVGKGERGAEMLVRRWNRGL